METIFYNNVTKDSPYKINIPLTVENEIRFICTESWDTEWSGILFYTYTGDFETNDLEINCKDICVLDIGSAMATEFDMNQEVINYMAKNNLLDCQIGLIHSHNNMAK